VKVSDRLSVTPSFFYQRIAQDNAALVDDPPGTEDAHYQPFDVREPFSDQFTISGLTVKYEGDRYEITSASGYWQRTQRIFQDISAQLHWALAANFGRDFNVSGMTIAMLMQNTVRAAEMTTK
jgi:hypothetical protein